MVVLTIHEMCRWQAQSQCAEYAGESYYFKAQAHGRFEATVD